jgi:hypothetical protein
MVDSPGYTCARKKLPSLEEDGVGDTRMVALPLQAGSVVGLGDRFQGSTPLCGGAIRISRLDGEDTSAEAHFSTYLAVASCISDLLGWATTFSYEPVRSSLRVTENPAITALPSTSNNGNGAPTVARNLLWRAVDKLPAMSVVRKGQRCASVQDMVDPETRRPNLDWPSLCKAFQQYDVCSLLCETDG